MRPAMPLGICGCVCGGIEGRWYCTVPYGCAYCGNAGWYIGAPFDVEVLAESGQRKSALKMALKVRKSSGWCPRLESNQHARLRGPLPCPLGDGGGFLLGD